MAGDLGARYAALERGDTEPLLELIPPDERDELLAPLGDASFQVAELVDAGDRFVAIGSIGVDGATLRFTHVWELEDGVPVRVRPYVDADRVSTAATRRQLAEVADELLEQTAEIRRQWTRLGDALRAASAEAGGPEIGGLPERGSAASARLLAVDMAEEGSSREEIEAVLRDELGVEDAAAILDEVFGEGAYAAGLRERLDESAEGDLAASGSDAEAHRLPRLFARNRG